MRVERGLHFHLSLYSDGCNGSPKILAMVGSTSTQNMPLVSLIHSLTHLHIERWAERRKLERQKHARRIIYHLDAIEGSFFHCLSSRSLSRHFVFYYKLSIQNNIQCLCLYTSSPNHYYRFISQINSKSVTFLVRSHFIFYIFGFWCSVFGAIVRWIEASHPTILDSNHYPHR